MWTVSQRRALIAMVAMAAGVLGVMAVLRPVYLGPVLPAQGARASELVGRLDPNTASAAMLSALPRLGQKRAKAIVSYRESFMASHPGRQAFERVEDLMNVKGIGPATAANLTPYLKFAASQK